MDKSLEKLELALRLSNLTAQEYYCHSWLYSLGCILIRVYLSHILNKDIYFVWLEALTVLVNNNIFTYVYKC